jgi:hypothetical protein
VLYVIIAFFFGLAGGVVGKLKGSSFLLWFLISGLIPVVGLITALASRDEHDEPVRPCPRCRRQVKLHDALCTRCGLELEYPGTESQPRAAALAGS